MSTALGQLNPWNLSVPPKCGGAGTEVFLPHCHSQIDKRAPRGVSRHSIGVRRGRLALTSLRHLTFITVAKLVDRPLGHDYAFPRRLGRSAPCEDWKGRWH